MFLYRLEMGYIYHEGQMEPVTGVDLILWQHGENGHPPTDYAFTFTAGRVKKSNLLSHFLYFTFSNIVRSCSSNILEMSLEYVLDGGK